LFDSVFAPAALRLRLNQLSPPQHLPYVIVAVCITRGPQIPIHFVDSVLVSNRLCWIRFCGFESQDSHFSSRPAIRIHFVHSVLLSNRLFGIWVLDSIRWIRIRVRISCVNSDAISRCPIASVCLGTKRPHVDVYRMTHLMLLMSGRRFLACLGISRRRIVSCLALSDSFVDDCVSWNDRTRTMGVCAFVLICMYNGGSSGGKRGEMIVMGKMRFFPSQTDHH